MSMSGQFPRIAPLIDREAEIHLMREMTRDVIETRSSRVLYFQARGGLGKTRLLEDYLQIVSKESRYLLVPAIVDMYDFENRKPLEIERKLVSDLKKAAEQQGMACEEIDGIFHEYEQKSSYFYAIRGFSHEATRRAENNIHAAFIESCNRLSEYYPLVLRFDTFETVLDSKLPEYAFAFNRERKEHIDSLDDQSALLGNMGDISANIVLRWFEMVLPCLRSSLIIMAGRPVSEHRFIDSLQSREPSLRFEVRNWSEITASNEIAEYLREYGLDVEDDWIPYIRKITGGLPLLLTLYVRTRPSDGEKLPRSSYEFEETLIEQTFNLLGQLLPAHDSDEPPNPRHTFIFCLYILSCARRGILRKDMRGVFEALAMKADDRVIDNLEDEMLIKAVRNWRQLEDVDEDPEQFKENTPLLLHDEIFVLIDQSKYLDDLHYREPILDYLCAASERQVREHQPGVLPLGILSDHMYYELSRDFMRGYCTYTIYVDRLLRQRYIQDALILADVFWKTLLYEVHRSRRIERPFYNKLAESLQVSIDGIRREEGARYVKRLRFSDDNAEAAARAESLYADLVGEGVLPADQDWRKFAELKQGDTYLFVDLCLTWAAALTRMHADLGKPHHLLTAIIRFLESDELRRPPRQSDELLLSSHLAYLRRTFFLGQAYNIRGQLYDQQQYHIAAVNDLERSLFMLRAYQESEIPLYDHGPLIIAAEYLNDDITADLAQVSNNLAYSALENGELDKALAFSDQVIHQYILISPAASTYQQALFYNTNALIRLHIGDYYHAGISLEAARTAADQSGVDRAIGLVTWAQAMYKRAKWNSGEMTATISDLLAVNEEDFAMAAAKLQGETGSLGELYHDRARFARELALFFQYEKDAARANDYWQMARMYLDHASEIMGRDKSLNMRRANLLETGACLFILRGDDQKGDDMAAASLLDQADTIMLAGMDMPSYANVVVGKIALQRGLLLLHQGRALEALRQMAIALARTYVFAPTHHSQAAFEKLIAGWVLEQRIGASDLSAFVQALYADVGFVRASDLPYLPPAADTWLNAWERSVKFFESLQRRAEEIVNEIAA